MVTTLEHITITQSMIEHAEERLQAGDLVQASEKGWGAVAHYLKAVAKQRGWRNESHRDFFTIKDRLARETDNPDRLHLRFFLSTRSLHQNFYEPLFSSGTKSEQCIAAAQGVHRQARTGARAG